MKAKNTITVGLIGNPNTGKTSLINSLTGLNLHVGNWSGKTVEKKECLIYFQKQCIRIVDLPGTYSIAPYSEEEKISRNFIIKEKPDVIVQTIDITTLKRHLLMTLELLALNKNIVLASNFNKEAERKNIQVDLEKIAESFQVPIVPIEAHIGKGKEKLLKQIIVSSREKPKIPKYLDKILKTNKQINYCQAIDFIKKKTVPFYIDKNKNGKTNRIDSFILNKYSAVPIFLFIMFLIFKATFSLSLPLIEIIDGFFQSLEAIVINSSLPELLKSFLTGGVLGGIGSILAFTPLVFILFFMIAILEDSGYLPRTVVLTDRLFSKFGISGRSFIPMMLGFGCNVPAIMATRTIKNKKERYITIFINSFISCGARLPIYILFTGIFFPENAVLIISLLYFTGIFVAFLVSFLLSRVIEFNQNSNLIIELPPYRMPTFRNVHKQAFTQTSLFIKKAGTIILTTVILIWFLASFPFGVEYCSECSLLGKIGKLIAPVFEPLGFGHWTFAVALLFGLIAKEVVVSTLGTLYGVGQQGLITAIPQYLNPAGALAFLFFSLLYVPCLATIAVIKKETNSWRFTIAQIIVTILIAWTVSFIVYRIALNFLF